MGKQIVVECFKSDNKDFIVGEVYIASVSVAELQSFMVYCKTLDDEREFSNGEYSNEYGVGFKVDPSVFATNKFELDLRMSNNGIISNAQFLKELLPEKLKPYKYIVTVNNYATAKSDRTKLNNLYKFIQNKRKQFEKVELGEWDKQKAIIMDMEKMIKKVSDDLGESMDAIDEKDRITKMEKVEESYKTILPSMPLKIPFEKFYIRKDYDAKKWTVEKIIEDMQKKIGDAVLKWNLLEAYLPEDPADLEQVKQVYIETLDSGKAKAKADGLKAIRERIKQQQAQTQAKPEPSPEQPKTIVKQETLSGAVKKQRIVVEFVSTRPFFDDMNQLILKHNPEYHIIKKEDI